MIDARKLITQPDESVNENKTRRVESCGEIVSYYSVVMYKLSANLGINFRHPRFR